MTDEEKRRAGLAFQAENDMRSSGAGAGLDTLQRQAAGFGSMMASRAPRTLAANPYNAPMADQTRSAQLALMQQMEAQRQGPSIAAMQGREALVQSTRQALMHGALGGGRGAMLGAGQTSAGLASDVARARMIEDLKSRAGIGGVATGLRGQDIRSAEQQMRTGQQAQGLSDEMARFYAGQGQAFSDAALNAQIEQYKLKQKLMQDERARQDAAKEQAIAITGSIFGGLL